MSINISTFVSGFTLIYGIIFFIQSLKWSYWVGYGPGAAFVPMWCNGLLIVLSGLYLFKSLKETGMKFSDIFPKGIGRKNLLITWVAMIIFVIIVKKVGLVISGSILLSILFGRGYKWYKAVLIGIVTTLICFIIFSMLLQVPVPVNRFGW